MKYGFLIIAGLLAAAAHAETLTSPDGALSIQVNCPNGQPTYQVSYKGVTYLEEAPLGLNTNIGDFTHDLTLSKTSEVSKTETQYTLFNIKRKDNRYEANCQKFVFSQQNKEVLEVTFQVSNNDVAFRYQLLPSKKDAKCAVINSESTGFRLPAGSTTFICPQMGEMTGFARTAPSYETHYGADEPMGKNGWGHGYTFPCLFHTPQGWVLISETGTFGDYCGCKIENRGDNLYQIGFPSMKENNGYGTNNVQVALPACTPWRTITVADNLKPVVETTVTWDVLFSDPSLAPTLPSEAARRQFGKKYGRGAWSWIIANDESCNFDTQRAYIDFAAEMGWESLLIDAMWDTQIGKARIAELANYGKHKGVNLYLWYNSNGIWNDAPQGPKNKMHESRVRREEMKWMHNIGIRGIKVDFFGGDKQCTMQLYHDILQDAEDFDIMVIFHGCTLPRGWEARYPNYVASEAVRASENLHFGQNECDREAMDATFLPFIRNAVGSMDFGGSTLNWYYNPRNNSSMWGGHRVTSDVFALATAILFQSPVQHFAMAPNNLNDAPAWAVEFMKKVPTTWEDIRFIDGYPGRFILLARKSEGKWYVTGINAQQQPLKTKLDLSAFFEAGQQVEVYSDDPKLQGSVKQQKLGKKCELEVTIPYNGGLVIK